MTNRIPPQMKNSTELSGYDTARANVDASKTKVDSWTEREYKDTNGNCYQCNHVRYEYFDSNNNSIMIQESLILKNLTKGTSKSNTTIFYTDAEGYSTMAVDYDSDNDVDRVVTFNSQHQTINNREIVGSGSLINVNNKSVNGDGSYSLYARDKNGAIIADHFDSKGKYSYSTGPNAHQHPNGFGIKPGDTSYNQSEDNIETKNTEEGTYTAYKITTNNDGSYSLYARDENNTIIADHFDSKGKYSHSTGPNAYLHPNGFGILQDSNTKKSFGL